MCTKTREDYKNTLLARQRAEQLAASQPLYRFERAGWDKELVATRKRLARAAAKLAAQGETK